MKKMIALMLAAGFGITTAILPARADDHKTELLNLIRQKDGPLEAMAVDKLITLNLSPAWWTWFLDEKTGGYHTLRNLADSLMTYGHNYGGDDIPALDESRDATSPLVADALGKLVPKAHMTIDFQAPVPEKFQATVKDNLDLVANPIGDTNYCKPRGKKLFVTVTLTPTAKTLGSSVTPDGTTYKLMLPAFMGISSSPIEEALKKGS